jgi:hypothetical protein
MGTWAFSSFPSCTWAQGQSVSVVAVKYQRRKVSSARAATRSGVRTAVDLETLSFLSMVRYAAVNARNCISSDEGLVIP